MKKTTLKIALCGLFSALGTIAFVLEGLFPPLIIPGARLGISNVFILLATIILGVKYGFIALTVKVFLGSLFSGNLSAMMYSLPSGLIALTAEYLLLKLTSRVSLLSISVCGAVINVSLQNVIFCLVTGTSQYLVYLPYLALIGIISGLAIGFIVYLLVAKLRYPPTLIG